MRTQETPLILLVGHCTPDAWMLRTAVGRADEDAEIDVVNEEVASSSRTRVHTPKRTGGYFFIRWHLTWVITPRPPRGGGCNLSGRF